MRNDADKVNKVTSAKHAKKGRGVMLRAFIIVIVIALLGFSAFFVADFLSSDDGKGAADIITVTILGSDIKLNDDTVITIDELNEYLARLDGEGNLNTVALIVDSANPPDVELHNRVVALLRRYGIEADEILEESRMDKSSPDEMPTPDESATGS